MALLSPTTLSRDGVDITGAAAAFGGDTFANTGYEIFSVVNGSGGSINVTFVTSATIDGAAVADKVVAVSNGGKVLIGPFPVAYYGSTVSVTYSGVSSVTVKVMKLVPA